MLDDKRCCGSGTCIINAEGFCWCGQKWDGTKMCFPEKPKGTTDSPAKPVVTDPGAESTPQRPTRAAGYSRA